MLLAFFAQSLHAEDWERPSLGFEAVSIEENAEVLRKFGKLPAKNGLLVLGVSPGSPAAKNGLRVMHVITHVQRRPVGSVAELDAVLADLKVNTPVTLQGYGLTPANVWKAGSIKSVVITERANLMGYVDRIEDKLTGSTYYRHVDAPSPTAASTTELYIGVTGDALRLKLRVSHVGSDWVFGERVLYKCGDETIEIALPNRKDDIKKTGGISESWDLRVEGETMTQLQAIAATRPSIVRIAGKSVGPDREMERDEWLRLGRMLRIYAMLGGQ